MALACVLYFTLLAAAAVAKPEVSTNSTRAKNEREKVESESLAEYISKLFRRNLQVTAGQTPMALDEKGLVLIRGTKFRTVKGTVLLLRPVHTVRIQMLEYFLQKLIIVYSYGVQKFKLQ